MMANKWMPIALGDRELPGWLTGVVLLLARCWVVLVFFNAGWLKLTSWDSTLYLFEFEYQVPLLPWLWAAWLGTAAELVLPLFLLAGLLTRPVALLLSGFNIMAVISYPALWAGGFHDHQLWGWMLLTLVIWGGGSLSLDSWLSRRRG
ncbi:DoxX family protein [Aeromonas enteropelogenes]|uniref:DoxX family protein n=1 Tax=Aeromonas enteropelogenes TaxID=29489 RepID=UPI001CC16E70|nr:DoxX family protein [Aeromonas enteropelogenes]UAK73407.1 DoxX family protein [Aeromonas enteropelogenes]